MATIETTLLESMKKYIQDQVTQKTQIQETEIQEKLEQVKEKLQQVEEKNNYLDSQIIDKEIKLRENIREEEKKTIKRMEDQKKSMQLELKKEAEKLDQKFEKYQKTVQTVEMDLKSREIVTINVGGTKYQTYLTTLIQFPGSYFHIMFTQFKEKDMEKKEIFLDRDHSLFRMVLNYLRDRTLPKLLHPHGREKFRKEMEYFNIPIECEHKSGNKSGKEKCKGKNIWKIIKTYGKNIVTITLPLGKLAKISSPSVISDDIHLYFPATQKYTDKEMLQSLYFQINKRASRMSRRGEENTINKTYLLEQESVISGKAYRINSLGGYVILELAEKDEYIKSLNLQSNYIAINLNMLNTVKTNNKVIRISHDKLQKSMNKAEIDVVQDIRKELFGKDPVKEKNQIWSLNEDNEDITSDIEESDDESNGKKEELYELDD